MATTPVSPLPFAPSIPCAAEPGTDADRPWIDTHCHWDSVRLSATALPLRRLAAQRGVGLCVVPAVEVANFEQVRQWAHQWGDAYALGIHPWWVAQAELAGLDHLAAALERHAGDPRLVAVGEIGLDHALPEASTPQGQARQAFFYEAQLRLAQRHRLPVILHVRRSADALLHALRRTPHQGGIVHAFNGSEQQALAFVAQGFKLGFGGAFTHNGARRLRHLAQVLPASAWVLETDGPDMPPQWLYVRAAERAQGVPQAPNSAAELPRIGAELAALRGLSTQQVRQLNAHNAVAALPKLGPLLALTDAQVGAAAPQGQPD